MRKNCCLIILSCYLSISLYAFRAQSQQKANAAPPANTHKDTSTSSRQILVRVQLAEVSLSKMRKLGIEFAGFQENELIELSGTEGLEFFRKLMYASGQFDGLLDALVKNKIAHLLADPSIVTVDGKTATLSVGRTVKAAKQDGENGGQPAQYIQAGTELTILPTLLSDRKVSIDLRLEWSEYCNQENPIDGVRKFQINTSLETELGSSLLMTSSSSKDQSGADDENETGLLLLVTPELIEKTASGKQSQVK